MRVGKEINLARSCKINIYSRLGNAQVTQFVRMNMILSEFSQCFQLIFFLSVFFVVIIPIVVDGHIKSSNFSNIFKMSLNFLIRLHVNDSNTFKLDRPSCLFFSLLALREMRENQFLFCPVSFELLVCNTLQESFKFLQYDVLSCIIFSNILQIYKLSE